MIVLVSLLVSIVASISVVIFRGLLLPGKFSMVFSHETSAAGYIKLDN